MQQCNVCQTACVTAARLGSLGECCRPAALLASLLQQLCTGTESLHANLRLQGKLNMWAAAAGPASASLAEDIPARARMMSTAASGAQGGGERLGLQSHLLPYWQQGVDPTEAWHAYEKRVRVMYTK